MGKCYKQSYQEQIAQKDRWNSHRHELQQEEETVRCGQKRGEP